MSGQQAKSGMTRWVDGAAWVRSRPLDPDELEEVQRRGAALCAGGSVALAGAGAALVLFLNTLFYASTQGTLPPLLQVLILLNLLLVSLLLLLATQWLPRGWSLLRDASIGHAECFEDQRGEKIVHRVEVLPRSGLPWTINGARSPRSSLAKPLTVATVADVPAFASVAAEWLVPHRTTEGETVHVGQRELSSAELGELRRLRTYLALRPAGVAGALSAWAVGAWSIRLVTGGYPEGHNGVVLLLLVVGAGVADAHAWRVLRLARKLSADLRLGRVGILRKPRPEADASEVESQSLTDAVEVLPTSGLAWTLSGRPARWRMLSPR